MAAGGIFFIAGYHPFKPVCPGQDRCNCRIQSIGYFLIQFELPEQANQMRIACDINPATARFFDDSFSEFSAAYCAQHGRLSEAIFQCDSLSGPLHEITSRLNIDDCSGWSSSLWLRPCTVIDRERIHCQAGSFEFLGQRL